VQSSRREGAPGGAVVQQALESRLRLIRIVRGAFEQGPELGVARAGAPHFAQDSVHGFARQESLERSVAHGRVGLE
jgi:hypothetical protein